MAYIYIYIWRFESIFFGLYVIFWFICTCTPSNPPTLVTDTDNYSAVDAVVSVWKMTVSIVLLNLSFCLVHQKIHNNDIRLELVYDIVIILCLNYHIRAYIIFIPWSFFLSFLNILLFACAIDFLSVNHTSCIESCFPTIYNTKWFLLFRYFVMSSLLLNLPYNNNTNIYHLVHGVSKPMFFYCI